MKFLIVFITLAVMAYQIKSDILDNSITDKVSNDSKETDQLEICEERICSRIYSPICISINDELFTVGSMCNFENLRCEMMKRATREKDIKISDFRVISFGECEESIEKSIKL